jgi:putative ABC transport system substrate-binding protein
VQGAGVVGLGLLAGCGRLPWQAQEPAKIPRVGFLYPRPLSAPPDRVAPFREGLRELGYVEGQNIELVLRSAEGEYERLPALAAELVRLPVDVIVASAMPAIQAAQQATSTIPIVMGLVVDPVETGLTTSLARPGGNITGLSMMATALAAKQLELLKETAPALSDVAVLWNPANPGNPPQLRQVEAAARALELRLGPVEARSPTEFEGAFEAITREQSDGLIVLVDTVFIDYRARIADFASTTRLPAVYGLRDHVEAGGLMSYSASQADMMRRAATYVDKILKGAKPADLPIEQPTIFDFVINLKTAQALGLTIPQHVLLQATEVIQ